MGILTPVMARYARVVALGIPYHVTHRGNRREPVFFDDEQRRDYCLWLAQYAKECGLEIWAYCLMDNHNRFQSLTPTANRQNILI